jgi:small ubiquitin-related modifier
MSDSEEEKPKVESNIVVVLKNGASNETSFKVKPTTKFGKLMNAYAKQQSKNLNTFRFFFEGRRILEGDTPGSLELENGDMVDVFLEQLGGCL